jgi:hypothetical protein
MENIGLLLLAIGFVAAWIIGYIANKNHWKIGNIF